MRSGAERTKRRRSSRKRPNRRKTRSGRLGEPKPSNCHPNPATCAAGSEALRSKVFAYRQMEHTSAGMQEGAASPFLCYPQRRRVRREERLQAASAIMFRPCASRTGTWCSLRCKAAPSLAAKDRRLVDGLKPCAARFPCAFPRPRLQAQGKRVLAEKAGSAGLFRQAGRSSRKRRGRRKAGHAGRARARRFGPACGPTRPGFPANSYRSLSPFAPVCRKAARSGEARRLPPRLDRPRQPCYLCVQHSGNAEAKRRCGCG